jgi:heat shock protein HslJ
VEVSARRTHVRRHLIPVLLVAVVITAACGDDGDVAGATTTTSPTERPPVGEVDEVEPAAPEDLIGVEWVVTGFVEAGEAVDLEQPMREGLLVFGPEGFVGGNDGCNHLGYSESQDGVRSGLAYDITDGTITYTGSPISTLIGCNEEGFVERFHEVIVGSVDFELDGDQLTLRTSDGRGVVFTAER